MLILFLIDLFYQRLTEWEGPFLKRWNNRYWKSCEAFKELSRVESVEECKQNCENESGCNVLTFKNASMSCNLRKCPTPVPSPNTPVNTGIKMAYFLPGKQFLIQKYNTHFIT